MCRISLHGCSYACQQIRILMIYLSYLYQKIGFDISCKLSLLAICVKCQVLCSGKSKKSISEYHPVHLHLNI